ncbi:MAG TPA: GlsB/YeaQ/YmgE family stress response membrane protein [Ktedonobacterales bacterium]|jgi:uncharacterized membrane protein YeaQ/YmgE (transglycosylase-associated protein family)
MLATLSIVMAGLLSTVWGWLVWIVIGGIAGAIADQLVQGNRLGCLGNVIVGILGGLLGGFLLGLIGIDVNNIIWMFLTALGGAIVLLLIVHLLTGGRGIGMRHR